jgi:hypothetical protein
MTYIIKHVKHRYCVQLWTVQAIYYVHVIRARLGLS